MRAFEKMEYSVVFFQVPLISMYRKELCHSLLKDPDAGVQESDGTPKLKFHKVVDN